MIKEEAYSDTPCEIGELKQRYKDWEILDIIPSGWAVDKTAGSPVCGCVFITNGESPLKGQKRALLRVGKKYQHVKPNLQGQKIEFYSQKEKAKIDFDSFHFDKSQAKTVNNLARQRFKVKLLNDILVDLTVCEIEGWSKVDYINELKSLINEVGKA